MERTCAQTGLRLIAAAGETAYRVAKDRYGGLSARHNSHVGALPVGRDEADSRGRFDTVGSTIYLADSRRCAYAEVLMGFRLERSKVERAAVSIGWDVSEYIAAVEEEAARNHIDPPWTVSVDWQMDRSMYEIRLPREGWWVQIDHAHTLSALERLTPRVTGLPVGPLTSGTIEGEDRAMTTLLAHVIRAQILDDRSEPLGIYFRSKTLAGHCWAYWDRRHDEGLPPGRDDLHQVASENVGPDPDFTAAAQFYRLPTNGRH